MKRLVYCFFVNAQIEYEISQTGNVHIEGDKVFGDKAGEYDDFNSRNL